MSDRIAATPSYACVCVCGCIHMHLYNDCISVDV